MKALMSDTAKTIKKDAAGQKALKEYLVSGDSKATIVLSNGKRFTVSSVASVTSKSSRALSYPTKKK